MCALHLKIQPDRTWIHIVNHRSRSRDSTRRVSCCMVLRSGRSGTTLGMGPAMIGELLYHLHRHFRLVVVVGGVACLGLTGALGWMAAKWFAFV